MKEGMNKKKEYLNEKLEGAGANFSIDNEGQAQTAVDLAREVLIEKVKGGETFDNLIECDPSDDKDFREKDFVRNYLINLDVNGRKTELANAEVHYQITFGGETELYVTKLNVVVKSLREGAQIGTALMRKIEADGVKLNCKKIILLAIGEFWLGQEHPYYFYKKLGFKNSLSVPEDELEKNIKAGRAFGVLMEKILT